MIAQHIYANISFYFHLQHCVGTIWCYFESDQVTTFQQKDTNVLSHLKFVAVLMSIKCLPWFLKKKLGIISLTNLGTQKVDLLMEGKLEFKLAATIMEIRLAIWLHMVGDFLNVSHLRTYS